MRLLWSLILTGVIATPVVFGQTPGGRNVCGLTSDLVTLNVSVWSQAKGYLKNFTERDFEIFNGKNKQEIACFQQTDEPASVGILFDLSESMRNLRNSKLDEVPLAVDGLTSFIKSGNSENEYFIIAFANETTVLLEPTQDRKEIENALKTLAATKPKSSTSVFDAVGQGFAKISVGKFDKKILLVISDGADTNSKSRFSNIKKLSQRNPAVMIYQVDIFNEKTDAASLPDMQFAAFFEDLTEASGGRVFNPRDGEQVLEAFATLAEELKSQYRIGFASGGTSRAKKDRHEIKVGLNLPQEARKQNGKIFVRARKGFYF